MNGQEEPKLCPFKFLMKEERKDKNEDGVDGGGRD